MKGVRRKASVVRRDPVDESRGFKKDAELLLVSMDESRGFKPRVIQNEHRSHSGDWLLTPSSFFGKAHS